MKVSRLRACLAAAVAAALLCLGLAPLGCGGGGEPVVLAASIDLEGSGILQAWADSFRSRTGRRVELVIVPDERALEMAKHGECDVVLTHSPEEEKRLERSGYLEGGQEVMSDDYLLVGPAADPAGSRDAGSIGDALNRIANGGQTFILRIDGSGTAGRQVLLWSISEVGELGAWLLPTDADAEGSLAQAQEEAAYTLIDRSNYQRLAGELNLEVLYQGDEAMANPYRVAAVSALTYPDAAIEGARELIAYLISPEAQRFFSLGAWQAPAQ